MSIGVAELIARQLNLVYLFPVLVFQYDGYLLVGRDTTIEITRGREEQTELHGIARQIGVSVGEKRAMLVVVAVGTLVLIEIYLTERGGYAVRNFDDILSRESSRGDGEITLFVGVISVYQDEFRC